MLITKTTLNLQIENGVWRSVLSMQQRATIRIDYAHDGRVTVLPSGAVGNKAFLP